MLDWILLVIISTLYVADVFILAIAEKKGSDKLHNIGVILAVIIFIIAFASLIYYNL